METKLNSTLKKTLALLAFVSFFVANVNAATLYSICSGGNWNDGNCWSTTSGGVRCNCTPGSGDIINVETAMNLNVNFTIGTGSLTIASGSSLTGITNSIIVQGALTINGTLSVFNLELKNNSNFYLNTGATAIIYGTFTNNNNSGDVIVNGTLNTNNFVNGQGSGAGADITGTGFITAATCDSPGTVKGTAGCTNVIASALPIELISFTATIKDKFCVINWVTATEKNNKFFSIEKSKDGNEFSILAKVTGAGNSFSEKQYSYTDNKPLKGNSYYRLKQSDYDGKFTYSDIVSLSNTNTKNNVETVFDDQNQNIQVFNSNEESIVTIQLIDLTGKILIVKTIEANSNSTISTQTILPGIYVLSINDGNSVEHKKVKL